MRIIHKLKNWLLLATICLLLPTFALSQRKDTGSLNTWTLEEVTRTTTADAANAGQKSDPNFLVNVRAARNKDFDRVVFEFNNALPPYQVKFADPPFNLDESDQIVKVAGKSFLEVIFTPAYGFNLETGKKTVTYKKGRLELPVVQETSFIYDHEAMVIFIVGLKQKKDFRVSVLQNPSRLVVDFKH